MSKNIDDMVGLTFSELTVIRRDYEKEKTLKSKRRCWLCRCICGNIISVQENNLKSGNTKSCGCMKNKWISEKNIKDLTGKRYGRLLVLKRDFTKYNKSRHTFWICKCDCGETVSINETSLQNSDTKSCGCLNRELASKRSYITFKDQKKEKHPQWKGGITDQGKLLRNSDEYEFWRDKVFERDNYTCQCCGSNKNKLNSHHKYNFSEYPSLRFDINNGITLCEQCHLLGYKNSFHSFYGVRNNTPEQLEEFISNYKKNHQESQNKDSLLLCSNE